MGQRKFPTGFMIRFGTSNDGGYVQIATVITVDLSRSAQALPGGRLRFQAVPLNGAQRSLQKQRQIMRLLQVHAGK
jgi:allophanate hydrolase subunit 2